MPRPLSRWVRIFGRAGFVSRGVVYLMLGLLVVLAAIGSGRGQLTDAQGAMQVLLDLPAGPLLVILVGAGLSGYALWRIAEAVFNLEHLDSSTASTCWRCFYLIDGLFHAAWAVLVFLLLVTTPTDGDEATRQYTAEAMQVPLGRWLVGLVGAGAAVGGVYLGFRAWSGKYRRDLKVRRFGRAATLPTMVLARAGETARGLVFVVFGFFLMRAAWTFDPDEAKGVGESLAELSRQPYGWWVLLSVGVGLACYGIYSMVEAGFREIGMRPKGEEA